MNAGVLNEGMKDHHSLPLLDLWEEREGLAGKGRDLPPLNHHLLFSCGLMNTPHGIVSSHQGTSAWLLPANHPCCISNPLHFLAYPTKKAPCRTTGSSLWLAGVCTVLPRPSVSRDQLCWDWNLKKDGLRSDKHPFPGSGSLPPPYLEAFVR